MCLKINRYLHKLTKNKQFLTSSAELDSSLTFFFAQSDDSVTDRGEVCNKGMIDEADLLCYNAHPGQSHTTSFFFSLCEDKMRILQSSQVNN